MNNSRQKELLLIIHSSFFSKAWVKSARAESEGWFSQKQQLKEACQDGLIPELLPECFEKTNNTPAPVWKINDANTFIDLVFVNTHKKRKSNSP
ncbi:MAG: hypothetical protein IPG38_10580 [Chitinophagaceae bacterium]|nr:hypothetical protein [Chitinophagaceae bacterium]